MSCPCIRSHSIFVSNCADGLGGQSIAIRSTCFSDGSDVRALTDFVPDLGSVGALLGALLGSFFLLGSTSNRITTTRPRITTKATTPMIKTGGPVSLLGGGLVSGGRGTGLVVVCVKAW